MPIAFEGVIPGEISIIYLYTKCQKHDNRISIVVYFKHGAHLLR